MPHLNIVSIDVNSCFRDGKSHHNVAIKTDGGNEIAEGDSQMNAFWNALRKHGVNPESIPPHVRDRKPEDSVVSDDWKHMLKVLSYLKETN